ncbi:hypothetical protein ISG33_13620 [Glaciecola sp. MH2013]|uniref:hypothetical protein n=1 Tax=Glaciecola sp. MH2013 TaxID=2785524 RepID=UPI0018A0AF91|nr:hypothetical protein [Glaciecola sp. MH2013]MBF7074440.1 hypothetical protein [Glaciecola sp. MH2013]
MSSAITADQLVIFAARGGNVPLKMALHHASDEVVRLLAWSGAKVKNKHRPHWKARLECCLNDN